MQAKSPKSKTSYPESGHQSCLQVEDTSFWFAHRNQLILQLAKGIPFESNIWDIGGGNGFVSLALEKEGWSTTLLEPGKHGCQNAKDRGLKNVICAQLTEIPSQPKPIDNATCCDVLEHIENDVEFLQQIKQRIKTGGTLILTVPAMSWLWSHDDPYAGHYRRYTKSSLTKLVEGAGFEVEYSSYFFTYLVPAIFLLRSLRSRWTSKESYIKNLKENIQQDHGTSVSTISDTTLKVLNSIELMIIRAGHSLPIGSSLILRATAKDNTRGIK